MAALSKEIFFLNRTIVLKCHNKLKGLPSFHMLCIIYCFKRIHSLICTLTDQIKSPDLHDGLYTHVIKLILKHLVGPSGQGLS